MLEFIIDGVVKSGMSLDAQKAWIKVRDESGFLIAFWGRPLKLFALDKDMNNIELIKSSALPFKLKVLSDGDYRAEAYERKSYGIKYSIGEDAKIAISASA